ASATSTTRRRRNSRAENPPPGCVTLSCRSRSVSGARFYLADHPRAIAAQDARRRARRAGGRHPLGRSSPRTQDVAEDALVRLARRPAVGALVVPYLLLERCCGVRLPDTRQVVVRLTQAAHLPIVDRAGKDIAPRVDEARGAMRMAAHGSAPRLEVAAHPLEVGALEVVDGRPAEAAQPRVVLGRACQRLRVYGLA